MREGSTSLLLHWVFPTLEMPKKAKHAWSSVKRKVGALLRQAREKAGLTQEQVAERLSTKKSAISRIENSAGSMRLSALERYARAIGWHLSLDLQPSRKSASPRK